MPVVYERENVNVNIEAIRTVKAMVKILKFYKDEQGNPQPDSHKVELLNALNGALSQIYNIAPPVLHVDGSYNRYEYSAGVTPHIHLDKPSIISFLHEYRHHLQAVANKMFEGFTDKEEDARAWSLRCFSKASPGNFLNSVKAGRVLFVKWDEATQSVIDDEEQIRMNNLDSAETRLRRILDLAARTSPEANSELENDMMQRIARITNEPEYPEECFISTEDDTRTPDDEEFEEYDWRNDPNHPNNDRPNCGLSGGV